MRRRTALDQVDTEELDESLVDSSEPQEMSFIDHLEELRWHIIRSVSSIVIFSLAAYIYIEDIFNYVILGPKRLDFWTYRMLCKISVLLNLPNLCVKKLDFILINREPAGQFMMSITLSLIIGVVCAFPYAFWELWRFIKPGLRMKERKAASGATFFVSVLFGLGVLFGYYIVTPLVINFLSNYKLDPSIANQFDITSYISTVSTLTLACGLMFQLPVVMFALSKAGIVTPKFLKTYRKHAVVVILVVAAVITPSPDVMSQMLVAMPLFLLYEVSIWVSASVWRKRKREEALEEL